MATIIFIFEGISTSIQCSKEQKMKDICNKYCNKINANISEIIFLYEGAKLNMNKKFEEYSKENTMKILVFRSENEICPKCGKLLDNKKLDDLILSNNNINTFLIGLKSQINNIINDNNKKINEIINQLRNINYIINHIIEDINRNNEELEKFKTINIENNKNENEIKNEIICIYDKQKEEINLLYDYHEYYNYWKDKIKKAYIEGKENINEKYIQIYVNDKKIKFNTKYKSNEKGEIKVLFKFNKLLTNTNSMFKLCTSLKSIDLSSFNTTNIKSMNSMFMDCSSLTSIDFSSFNTTFVEDMSYMFAGCSSLKSLDLSSLNTTNVKDMSLMFEYTPLISLDLSSFDTTNVKDMSWMFDHCSSLKSLDLSSFNTTNVKEMHDMFYFCSSLKRENVKANDKRILEELSNI